MYRQCGLAYVVAFANGGAKDVTRRYIGHMPYTQKLRDSKWFKHLLAPLHKAEVRQAPAGLDLQLHGVQAPTGPLCKAEGRPLQIVTSNCRFQQACLRRQRCTRITSIGLVEQRGRADHLQPDSWWTAV